MAVNKVTYGGRTLIDISDSTVTPSKLAKGVIAYTASGERIVGTATVEPTYTDLFDKSTVLLNARSNSSNKIVSSNGTFITGKIALPDDYATNDCFLYLKGINPTGGSNISYSKVLFFEETTEGAVAVGDAVSGGLQFTLSTANGVCWETLDANSLYYKIDLRKNATGVAHGGVLYYKYFALALNISSSALTLDSLPDIIMAFEPIE